MVLVYILACALCALVMYDFRFAPLLVGYLALIFRRFNDADRTG